MPRRKTRGGNSRGRGGRNRRPLIDNFTFSLLQGNEMDVKVANISSRPPRCNFRPLWLEVQVCGYQPGSSSTSGWLAPVGCQLACRSEADGVYCATSKLIACAAVPRKIRVYYPRSADWYPWNISDGTTLFTIIAICIGPTVDSNTKGYLRGVGRVAMIYQEEYATAGCPALGDIVEEHRTWAEICDAELWHPRPVAAASQRRRSTDNDRASTSACSLDSVAIDLSFLDLE